MDIDGRNRWQKSRVLASHSTIRSTGSGTIGCEVTYGPTPHILTEECPKESKRDSRYSPIALRVVPPGVEPQAEP